MTAEIKAKYEYFNSYFSDQCTTLVSNNQLSTRFTTHTDSILTSIGFSVKKLQLDRNAKATIPGKWKGLKSPGICFSVIFSCYDKGLISGEDTGR